MFSEKFMGWIGSQQPMNKTRNQKKKVTTKTCYQPTLGTVLIVSKCLSVLYFIIKICMRVPAGGGVH
jgi:hypothetical protein